MNPINNTLILLSTAGFAAAILILGASTNGSIDSLSALQQQQFVAKLSGSNEVPPVQSSATGTAKFTVGPDGKSLNYVLTVTNMNGITGAHIHSGKQGESGPIVVGLFNSGTLGPPTGKENGVLSKGNITSSNLQGTLPGKQISDLVNLMKGNGTYVSINTQKHQNGEIRGQIG